MFNQNKSHVRSRYRMMVEQLESRALFAGLINIEMPIPPTPTQIPAVNVSIMDTTVGFELKTADLDKVPSYLNENRRSEGRTQDQNDSESVTGETDADGLANESPDKDSGANEPCKSDQGDESFNGSSGTASPPVSSPSRPSFPVYSMPPLLSRTDSPTVYIAPIVSPNPESHFHYFQSASDQPNHRESAISDEMLTRLMVRDSFVAAMTLNKMGDENHIAKTRSATILIAHSESASTQAFQSDATREGVAETERQELIDRAMSSMEFATEIVQNADLVCAAAIDAERSQAVIEDGIANVESRDVVTLTTSRSEPKLRLRTSRFELLGLVSILLPISMVIKKRQQIDRMTVRPLPQNCTLRR